MSYLEFTVLIYLIISYISKSVGGNSSKIHLIVDAHGNPIDFMITDGTTHDVKVAPDLISTLDLKETKVVCADKGYDSEPLREQIRKTGTKANIPKKTNSQSTMTIWTGIYIKSGI